MNTATSAEPTSVPPAAAMRSRSDLPFVLCLGVLSSFYVFMILAMLVADLFFTSPGHLLAALGSREIQYAIKLSLITCTLTTILSLWVAVPTGYLMSRYRFAGKGVMNAILDIPIVLPPLVIGLSLLILFQVRIGPEPHQTVDWFFREKLNFPITYAIPSVVLAQFMVACAFAVRTMLVTFEQINPRREQVAMTLGCSRNQAFWLVALPEARRGILTAATLAWARALGEFGPILVFSGATRMRTEVLPTTVFLELSIGNIEAALAVSLLMVIAAVTVLVMARVFGLGSPMSRPL
jgi:molybdate transport system permease protein